MNGPRLAAQLDLVAEAERRRALKTLLRHPLVTPGNPDAHALVLIRRHAGWLRRWFGDLLGYRLIVEADFARLEKIALDGAPPRPVRNRSGQPFTPRGYAHLCLVLAALERVEAQTALSQLAEQVHLLTAAEERVATLDLDRAAERRSFVHAVQALCDLGCMRLRDGDEEGFVRGSGDALYDVFSRRVSRLMATQVPPALAGSASDLRLDPYPSTEEGRRRRIRHMLMRRLCEEAAVYFEELDDDEASYLKTQKGRIARDLEAAGFAVEIRAEGMAAIDPDAISTDAFFPADGTTAHAALHLAGRLADTARTAQEPVLVPEGDIEAHVRDLAVGFGRYWRRDVTEDERGPARLARAATDLLAALSLVRAVPGGAVVLPAIARFEPHKGDPR